MSDDIIKNPHRKNKPVARSKYVPEWARLGKEPIVYEGNPSDAMFLNSKKRSPMKSSNVVTSNTDLNQEQTVVHQPPKVKRAPVVENSIPHQTKISVGQNKNWFDSEEDPDASSDIMYDEIPDPPSPVLSDDSGVSDEQSLQPGEYGVLIKGVVVVKTFVLKEAEAIIEKILFDQLPQFSKVSIDDIALHMRLPLKVGVLAVLE